MPHELPAISMNVLYLFGIYFLIGVWIAFYFKWKLKKLTPVMTPMMETYLKLNMWFGIIFAVSIGLGMVLLCYGFRAEWGFV